MAEANATTRPARTRASRTPAAAKPAASKPATTKPAAKTEAPAKAEAQTVTRFTVELEHVGTTARFEKFGFPDSYSGVVVGNVYAPIGTASVKVLVIGAGDNGAE